MFDDEWFNSFLLFDQYSSQIVIFGRMAPNKFYSQSRAQRDYTSVKFDQNR